MLNENLTCINDYSQSNEEQNSFQPGWINLTYVNYSSSIVNAFKYQSSNQLDTYDYNGNHGKYDGSGYVYQFRGRLSDMKQNISQLYQLQWIDKQTRMLIIQLSLYNPNAQMFTFVTLLCEFLPTGGIFPSARFQPFYFQSKILIILTKSDRIV